jgi:hypothetical protein
MPERTGVIDAAEAARRLEDRGDLGMWLAEASGTWIQRGTFPG